MSGHLGFFTNSLRPYDLILNEADYILIPGIYLSRIITGVGSFHGGTHFDDSSGMTFMSAVTVLLTKLYS